MENLSEIIITIIAGIILGLIFGDILFKKFKLIDWIRKKKINKTAGNPEVLKKKLEENGEIIDMGQKVHIDIIKDSGGKEVLDIKRDPKIEEEIIKLKPKKKKKKAKYLGKKFEDSPSPHKIDIFEVNEGATLEDLENAKEEDLPEEKILFDELEEPEEDPEEEAEEFPEEQEGLSEEDLTKEE